MSSQARSSGVKNDNIPLRIIAFARIRRLRRECCLNVVLEDPGAPNGWRRGPREQPEGSQESPKKHRGATKSTRSDAKRASKNTQNEAKRAIESPKAKCVIPIPDDKHENHGPAEARARFSMPEKRRGANLPREGAVDPLCKEKSVRLGVRSDMSQNARKNQCGLANSSFYSNFDWCPRATHFHPEAGLEPMKHV